MKETLLKIWQDAWPGIKSTQALPTGEGVIDESAFNTLEVDKVFDAVNYASTTIGQAVLYRSLARPLDNLDDVQAKQEAVRELGDNPQLTTALAHVIEHAASQETDFYRLLFGHFVGTLTSASESHEMDGYGYSQYKKGVRFMLELVEEIQALAPPKSPYLKSLFDKITAFADTRPYSLMKGPMFLTEKGIQCKEERRGSLLPAVIFVPRIIKPLLLALAFVAYWLGGLFIPNEMKPDLPQEAIFLTPLLLLYFPIVGSFDRDKCIVPLRNIYKNSEAVGETLDALGQLDELLSFLKFAEHFGHCVVLPTLIDSPHHRMNLDEARNPVLSKTYNDYVGNDLVLDDEKLMLVTGPNSGGKTAFCKTITQIQLLAQIGCFVPAKAATLTVADRIFYQVPEISHLNDGEGRFGTELKRTKDIFLATTEKSLVVLDELSEGTTFEEKMESSTNVLNGFYRKGNSTVLITHNHQLVDYFVKKKIGMPKQVEFANDAPTYKLVPGISRVSHADRVAKKIGFSKEDIDNYLAETK
ncbi:MAG: DNA mismatch repair protein MutS [Methylovulum sp.]|uniref:MutS-related protein n=1 Tax=Methylovulum sp. TaxID=1916980 RepID=UPI0026262061|nr:DNA mismatch repair protein MutS [Methylovulum sp.]MDD2725249.1 DNA mismatch repair protein MutS [Methylovulum sp.]MDD5125678.1 DNA mismatch repair protein MutS [Methylovulum sp.]